MSSLLEVVSENKQKVYPNNRFQQSLPLSNDLSQYSPYQYNNNNNKNNNYNNQYFNQQIPSTSSSQRSQLQIDDIPKVGTPEFNQQYDKLMNDADLNLDLDN